jgi:hypothetical protein
MHKCLKLPSLTLSVRASSKPGFSVRLPAVSPVAPESTSLPPHGLPSPLLLPGPPPPGPPSPPSLLLPPPGPPPSMLRPAAPGLPLFAVTSSTWPAPCGATLDCSLCCCRRTTWPAPYGFSLQPAALPLLAATWPATLSAVGPVPCFLLPAAAARLLSLVATAWACPICSGTGQREIQVLTILTTLAIWEAFTQAGFTFESTSNSDGWMPLNEVKEMIRLDLCHGESGDGPSGTSV